MTAYKVISSHDELNNVGNVSHDQIDTHISGSQFLILSSSINTPLNSRKLILGQGVTYSDAGPGGNFNVSVDPDFIRSIFVFQEKVEPTPDGYTNIFTIQSEPILSSSLMLYVNGQLQAQGENYDYVLNLTTITMSYSPRANSNLFAFYPKSI